MMMIRAVGAVVVVVVVVVAVAAAIVDVAAAVLGCAVVVFLCLFFFQYVPAPFLWTFSQTSFRAIREDRSPYWLRATRMMQAAATY